MDYLQVLDAVLRFMNSGVNNVQPQEISKKVIEANPELDKNDMETWNVLYGAVRKLEKDGYLGKYEEIVRGADIAGRDMIMEYYHIKLEGKIFIAQGGYVEKAKNDELKVSSEIKKERHKGRLDIYNTVFQGIMAISGISIFQSLALPASLFQAFFVEIVFFFVIGGIFGMIVWHLMSRK